MPRGILVWRAARYFHQRGFEMNVDCEFGACRPHAIKFKVIGLGCSLIWPRTVSGIV